jgi:pSer/pThr/pTyr-binding forkhead associated (FHA) protein/PAS domain-containing protein
VLKLKYLNSDLAGQFLNLKSGENTVGRLPECEISLTSPGVSKRHAKLIVQETQCLLKDLGSSNGTFVNGSKVSERILRPGDRIAFHNLIFELMIEKIKSPLNQGSQSMTNPIPHSMPHSMSHSIPHSMPQISGSNLALQQQPMENLFTNPILGQVAPKNLADVLKSYAQNVIMPGIYKLVEMYPLKNVLGVFLLIYVVMVTFLSTIPMVQMTKAGIQKEAQRRALTIARQLGTLSEKALASGTENSIPDLAQSEDGIILSVLVSKQDGHLIAPLSKSQSYSNEEFVARGRKHDETFIQQISDTSIGVSVPVRTFNQEAGQPTIAAYAQVIYKMDSFQWDESIGLLARVLIIALLLGSVIYAILYRVLAQPIEDATRQLDEALRGERDTITSKYDFDIFNKLLENVNGALGRISQQPAEGAPTIDRASEASNLVRIISDASFALDGNGHFLQINSAFQDLTGMRLLSLQGQSLEALQDQALKLNLEDLISRAKAQPGTVVTSTLDMAGVSFDIDIQASAEGHGIGYILGTLKRGGTG